MLTTEVKYTIVDELSVKLAKIEERMAKFDKLIGHTDDNLKKLGKNGTGTMFDKLIPNNTKVDKLASTLNEIPNLNLGIASSAGTLANPYVLAGAAVVGFGAYTMDAIQLSQEWDKTMAKVNVTADLSKVKLGQLSSKIADMAETSTVDFMQVPDAFNQILSGVGDIDKSMDLLKYSLKGAQAGFTDIKTVADAGVNIMNSVGKQTKGANEIFDVLFATLNKGKGEFKDISDYLPRILPYSNQLGVSFKETASMFALMTATGQTTEQSTMLLQNAFTNLLDSKKREKLEKFVKIFDNHGKVRPMVELINDMSNKLKGLSDHDRVNLLDKFGFDTQAAGAFSVLTQNADRLKEFVDYISNSSANGGALQKAVEDSENASQNIDKIHNKWNAWKRDWGSAQGWFTDFTHSIITAMGYLEKLGVILQDNWHFLSNLNKLTSPSEWVSGNMGEHWNNLTNMDTYASRKKWYNEDGERVSELRANVSSEFFMKRDKNDKKFMDLQENYGLKNFKGNSIYEKAVNKFGKNVDAFMQKYGVEKPNSHHTTEKSLYTKDLSDDDKKKAKHKSDRAEKGLREVAGGGSQIRNVTIHIGKQIEKVEVNTTNMQDIGMNKIKKILEELLMTQIRDVEILAGQ